MNISARVDSSRGQHKAVVSTNGAQRSIDIPSKETGFGSSVNGGELLCLALATCYCNDLYREAAKIGISVAKVEVDVNAEFGGEGEAAKVITYSVNVVADATDEQIRDLIAQTDKVAEIHNTLRQGLDVSIDFRT
jgi:uncharacterized OsmC-like protein